MSEPATLSTWTTTKIWLLMLKILSKFGIERAKEKLRNNIKVEIESKMNLNFATEWSYPGAWLNFKVRNYSDVDLSPKNIVAWVILGGVTIDKISWSQLENAFLGLSEVSRHYKIPNLPATIDDDFILYYPLPLHVDFGINRLSLVGVIEFDCLFGTVVKSFQTRYDLSKEEWKNALDKWQKDCIDKKTVFTILGKQTIKVQ